MITSVESPSKTNSPATPSREYTIGAYASVSCPLASIPEMRKQLTGPDGKPFAPSFLKPSDEQTITSIAAVMEAINRHHLQETDFTEWGVIAAVQYVGRISAAAATQQFRDGGAWKASPLFVPHHFLHAVSGTISQALKIHGPNFGVGGGPKATEEGLVTCLSFLDQYQPPGLWAIFSECNPEPLPDADGKNHEPVVCHAVALAFVPAAGDELGLRLSLKEIDGTEDLSSTSDKETSGYKTLFPRLSKFIEEAAASGEFGPFSHPLSWGRELRLSTKN